MSWLGLTVASLLAGCGVGDRGSSQAICTYHVTDFSLPDLAGRPHRVREYLEREPVLLYFFTSWCPYCRSEIPQLKEIERERDALGVRLVAIGAGLNDTVQTVRRYALRHRLPYVILYDDGSTVSERFGVTAVPAAFLVRQDGCVTALGSRVTASSLKPFLQAHHQKVRALIAGLPSTSCSLPAINTVSVPITHSYKRSARHGTNARHGADAEYG